MLQGLAGGETADRLPVGTQGLVSTSRSRRGEGEAFSGPSEPRRVRAPLLTVQGAPDLDSGSALLGSRESTDPGNLPGQTQRENWWEHNV